MSCIGLTPISVLCFFQPGAAMYFWTNTPDQIQFIAAAATVNRLRAYISDPSTSEEDASIYAQQLIAAGLQMEAVLDAIANDWSDWLKSNKLEWPTMGKSGDIYCVTDYPEYGKIRLERNGAATTSSGETFFWEDFYRMIALLCFFGRVPPPEGHAKYDPKSYFHG